MTNREVAKILDNIIIVIDSREKVEHKIVNGENSVIYKNKHIRDYLDNIGVRYVVDKLEFGDYSYVIPNIPELSSLVAIERKSSLDEIATNFGKHRERFENEFKRGTELGIKKYCLIENATWTKIFNSSYRGKLHKNSMISSILAFQSKYDTPFYLVKKSESPELIYNIIIWNLRKILQSVE